MCFWILAYFYRFEIWLHGELVIIFWWHDVAKMDLNQIWDTFLILRRRLFFKLFLISYGSKKPFVLFYLLKTILFINIIMRSLIITQTLEQAQAAQLICQQTFLQKSQSKRKMHKI